MVNLVFIFDWVFIIAVVTSIAIDNDTSTKLIDSLVAQWSPLIWLHPDEKYMPSSVEDFLSNVLVADENGKIIQSHSARKLAKYNSKSFFLVTRQAVDVLLNNETNSAFLIGKNPKECRVPVYAAINACSKYQNPLNFIVTYWIFYPYNEGKEICFIGKVPTPFIFNTCFGRLKTIGNHIGDWEHMSLEFIGNMYPSRLYLAVHDAGVYYKYDQQRKLFKYESQVTRKGVVQVPKFPRIVRMQGGHPVLFAALGSHGLWSAPGEHDYVRVPRFSDKNGYGIPWKTWNNVVNLHLDHNHIPDWMQFKGKWGNPKSNCFLSRKLGVCEYTDGPLGILRKQQDFYCRGNY